MELKEQILSAIDKETVRFAVNNVGEDSERFAFLVALMLSSDTTTARKAAWVFSHCVEIHPALITPHLSSLIKNLFTTQEDAVKRNTMRALQYAKIPESLWGEVVEIAFRFLTGPEAVAIKVFAMTVLFNLSLTIPEIRTELRVVIEDQLPYGSVGFKSRGTKILSQLNKID